jgi:hypothetical protein
MKKIRCLIRQFLFEICKRSNKRNIVGWDGGFLAGNLVDPSQLHFGR